MSEDYTKNTWGAARCHAATKDKVEIYYII